jgi:hypothetical protein
VSHGHVHCPPASPPSHSALSPHRSCLAALDGGWVGGSVLGIVNGVIRELVYRDRVGELRANQIEFADREGKDDETHRHRHRRQ